LQITAVSIVRDKNKKRVRSIEYSSTLKFVIDDAIAKRIFWMQE